MMLPIVPVWTGAGVGVVVGVGDVTGLGAGVGGATVVVGCFFSSVWKSGVAPDVVAGLDTPRVTTLGVYTGRVLIEGMT
jgi:hypothetical protein